jgi:putative redox protein
MTISVVRDQSAPMRHHVHIGAHVIATDAPADEGGEASGPTPHDLYDAALGACKALTVLYYAKRKGYPVQDIRVTVDRDSSEERHGTYRLATTLHVTGAVSEEQRNDLLRVAGKCPVHKLMTVGKTEITTALAEPMSPA